MSVLRLDRNEGPPPAADLLAILGPSATEALRRYPSSDRLEAIIADLLGRSPGEVLVTAGADDAIDRCCRRFLGRGRTLLTAAPTFPLIAGFARLAGAHVQEVAWTTERFPGAAFAANMAFADLAAVVTPNNPTGFSLQLADFERLVEASPDVPILLDHTYVEYADDDLTTPARAHRGVVVVRTLSKAWGMAGCRIGYALGHPDVIASLRASGPPFAVAGPSLLLAEARLGRGTPREHVSHIRQERTELTALLRELGIAAGASHANFVLAQCGARAPFIRDGLRALGIVVRDCADQPLLSGALRISLPGDRHDFQRLCTALECLLAPEALLFDLDGVLADVRESYDRCIEQTAASFGVRVEPAAIDRLRNAGDANDDRRLTHAFLAGNGCEVSLDLVTQRFQERYLGTEALTGLRDRERWLPAAGLLQRLAARARLGIVTGRPREEAEWLLRREGVRQLFDCVVAREDAPLKPDPAPVRLALRRLGVRRAWLIGDTPDDVRAALRAGALPLGIPAPGTDAGAASQALREAGAAAVIGALEEMEALWT